MHRFSHVRRTRPALLGSFAAAGVLLAASIAYGADPPPPPPDPAPPVFTSGPTVQGDAVVGATLTALATWTGEPAPKVKYQWSRCPASGGACKQTAGATAATYVVSAADVGSRLGVAIDLNNSAVTKKVTAKSPTTDIVVAAPTTPTPTPTPGPTQPPTTDPKPDPTPDPGSAASSGFPEPIAPAVSAKVPTILRPFPVVRIRGYYKRGGVRVTLLSVNAPRSAHISARCVGKGCPVRTVTAASAPARLRPFERFLPAGTVLQVRVTSPGRIGKYASFVIRAHSAPQRNDLCLMPGKLKPAACPAP